jgi:16S rRNA (cytidine1402-2'-O)-methyltransferase
MIESHARTHRMNRNSPSGSSTVGRETRASRPSGKSAPSKLSPGLYVTATPIGNARDITLRALDVLGHCDAIVVEDTRVTARLLAIHGIAKPLLTYNDHNAARERPRILARLRTGERLALVSDAGMPLISDPGFKLVREVLCAELAVHVVPGVSAPLAALALAGLPTDRFLFAGFLPSRSGERQHVLGELKSIRATLVFFESPQRLAESLSDMVRVLGNRAAAVARELTKLHEEVRRGPLAELASAYKSGEPPKGEVTVLVGPPGAAAPDTALTDALLSKALAFMPIRAAADLVAQALDGSRHAIYERALLMRKNER